MKKRLLALLLTFIMVISLLPAPMHAYAETSFPACTSASGTHTWKLVSNNQFSNAHQGRATCDTCMIACLYPGFNLNNYTKYTHDFEVVLTDCTTAQGTRTCKNCGIYWTGDQTKTVTGGGIPTVTKRTSHDLDENNKCKYCTYVKVDVTQTKCSNGGAHVWKVNANGANGYSTCNNCKARCAYAGYKYTQGELFVHEYTVTTYTNCKTGNGTKTCKYCKSYVTGNDVFERGNHVYDANGACTVCTYKCTNHTYSNGKCTECGKSAPPCTVHTDSSTGKCPKCGAALTPCPDRSPAEAHTFINTGVCSKCGAACEHNKVPNLSNFVCNSSAWQSVSTKCSICSQVFAAEISVAPNSHFMDENGKCLACGYVCEHESAEDDGNCATPVICGVCKATVVPAKEHTPVFEKPEEGCLSNTICGNDNCNHVISYGRANHTQKLDDNNCTTAVTCAYCDHVFVEAKSHTPKADDGDCTTDIYCANAGCYQVAVEGQAYHVQPNDDGNCMTPVVCANDGCNHTFKSAQYSHTPGTDDGDCTTPIKCANCEQIATAGNAEHTADNDDGNCETQVLCKNQGCNQIVIPAKEHINLNDDHNCLTAEMCDNEGCNKTIIYMQNSHVPGTDDGDCTTDILCKNEGCEQVAKTGNANHVAGVDDGDCATPIACVQCGTVVVEAKAHEPKFERTNCEQEVPCANCSKIALAAGQHDYNDDAAISEVKSTCKTYGSQTFKCKNCEATKVVDLTELDENNHENVVTVNGTAATCTEAGWNTHQHCTACGNDIGKEAEVATGHKDAEWKNEVSSTCKVNGVKGHYHCAACGKDFLKLGVNAAEQSAESLKLPLDTSNHAGELTTTYYINSEDHTKTVTCDCGGTVEEVTAGHEYGDNHECVCGAENHAHSRYETTATTHQSICSCGQPLGAAAGHEGGTATCSKQAVCSVCNVSYGELDDDHEQELSYKDNDGDTHTSYYPCCNTVTATNAHDQKTIVSQIEANCVTKASTTYTCTCGKTYTVEGEENSENHVELQQVAAKAPTCGEAGYKAYEYCTKCTYTTYEADPATGNHTYDNACDETCNGCTHVREVAGHSYTGEVTNVPTCTTPGVKTFTCGACGDNYTEGIAATGHKDAEYVQAKASTCKTAGNVEYYYCPDCQKNVSAKTVDATVLADVSLPLDKTNHEELTSVSASEATCTASGWKAYETCICDYTTFVEIPAIAHKNATEVPAKESTCKTAGNVAYFQCPDCQKNVSAKTVDADVLTNVKLELNASNHEQNLSYKDCDGDTHTPYYPCCDMALDAKPHDQKTLVSKTDGNCVTEATAIYTCTCGKTYTVKGEVNDDIHAQLRDVAAKAATCTQDGWEAYEYCEKCDYTTKVVIPAGHKYESVVTAPTCEEAGYTTYTCTCGDTYTEAGAAALGHKMEQTAAKVEPTCTVPGKEAVLTCANGCGKTEGGGEIAAKGHKMEQTAAKVEPTCTVPGKEAVLTCANGCGKTEGGEEIAAKGHIDDDNDNACDNCGEQMIATKPETSVNVDTSFDAGDITSELINAGYGSVEAIRQVLLNAVADKRIENSVLYNLTLMYSVDGGNTWHVADEEHFPESGMICVSFPVPEGTSHDTHDYHVVHMFSKDAFGKRAGDVEYPAVTERKDSDGNEYIDFCVTGLSPVLISWSVQHECDFEAGITSNEDGTHNINCSCGEYVVEKCNDKNGDRFCDACGYEMYEKVCVHENIIDKYTAPTCTEPGSVSAWCPDCNFEKFEWLDPTGHNYIRDLAQEPTCEEDGVWFNKCDNCGDFFKEPEAALGHKYDENGKCMVCENQCEHVGIVDKYTAPTCTEWGCRSAWCQTCNFEKMEMLKPTGHNYIRDLAQEPTCEEDGVWFNKCDNCGDFFKEPEAALGHKYDKLGKCEVCDFQCEHVGIVDKYTAPTCTEWGSQSAWCQTCNFEKMEMLKPTGHNYIVDEQYTPTCDKAGLEWHKCDKCGDFKEVEIAALGHTFKDGKCAVCGEKSPFQAAPKCQHEKTHTKQDIVEATCTEAGYILDKQVCDNCGEIVTSKEYPLGDATGHAWEGGICTVCGEKSPFTTAPEEDMKCTFGQHDQLMALGTKCPICGEWGKVEDDSAADNAPEQPDADVDPNAHKCMAETKAVANKDGLSHSIVCAECGEFWKNEAHNWEDGICTECDEESPFQAAPVAKHEGCLKSVTCTGETLVETEQNGKLAVVWACGKRTIEDIAADEAPKCEHKDAHFKQVIEDPTCTEDGYIIQGNEYCDECEKFIGLSQIITKGLEAKGHKWADGVCTECGDKSPFSTAPNVEDPSEEPTEPEATEPKEEPKDEPEATEPKEEPKDEPEATEPKEEPKDEPEATEPKEEPKDEPEATEPKEEPAEKPVDPELDEVPKTGDSTGIILAAMTGFGLLTALAYVFGKKRIAG